MKEMVGGGNSGLVGLCIRVALAGDHLLSIGIS